MNNGRETREGKGQVVRKEGAKKTSIYYQYHYLFPYCNVDTASNAFKGHEMNNLPVYNPTDSTDSTDKTKYL